MKLNKFYYTFAFLFYLVSTSLYVYANYDTSKQKLLADLDSKLIQSALRLPTIVPENFHHLIMTKNEVSVQKDFENIRRLSAQVKLSGVEYIYSCIKQGDDIVFTSSSATDQELKENRDISHYFDVYSDASQKLRETFDTKKITFDEYTDKWGHFKSVFIPKKSNDGQLYLVCADIKIDYINQELKQILKESIIELFFYMLILIPLFAAYVYDSRGHRHILETEVQRRTRELRTLLNNSDQGFLTFSGDMIIHPQYSEKCVSIFHKEIHGLNISDLLFTKEEKQKNAFADNIRSLIGDNDELRVENILSLLRSEFTIAKKTITVEYRKIGTETFMLILTDVTEKRALEKRLEIEKNKLQMVVSAIENSSEFFELLDEYSEFIANRFDLVDDERTAIDNIRDIYREVHTFKGLFSQKDFIVTPMGLHKLEEKLSLLLNETATTNNQLLDLLKKAEPENWLERDLAVLEQVLGENFLEKKDAITLSCTDIDNLTTKIRLCAQDMHLQGDIIEKIISKVDRLKEKSFFDALSSYTKLLEKLSQKLGKYLNPLTIECDKSIVLEDKYKPFVKSLVHLFRNCVDHGLESPEERIMKGKEEMGSISCILTAVEGGLVLRIQDDGAGINTLLVAQTAVNRGILTQSEADALSAEKINLLIFHENFSTKEAINTLSGRGVGLGALKHELELLGGSFHLRSVSGVGTIFSFFIPIEKKEVSMSARECTDILTQITLRARSFLSEEMGIELLKEDFEILRSYSTDYAYTVKIGITGSVNGIFVMGFERDALENIANIFDIGAHWDTDHELIIVQTASEVANTVLGNALMSFPNKGSGVKITPPFMIESEKKLLEKTYSNVYTSQIKTSFGIVMLAFFSGNTIEDNVC